MRRKVPENPERVVVWFSCGAASAVAAKLAVQKYGDKCDVCYIDMLEDEHPDNSRFLKDVEKWIGREIKLLKSDKYKNVDDVIARRRYIAGVNGAPCSMELKKAVRQQYERFDDVQIFGLTLEEKNRIDRFHQNNPEICAEWILVDKGLTHDDCVALIWKAGIEVPTMYKLGFPNNNCLGCVKGQSGYWNHTRKHFPEVFAKRALQEREVGAAINKKYVNGVRIPVFLDELPEDAGNMLTEPAISCSLVCGIVDQDIKAEDEK